MDAISDHSAHPRWSHPSPAAGDETTIRFCGRNLIGGRAHLWWSPLLSRARAAGGAVRGRAAATLAASSAANAGSLAARSSSCRSAALWNGQMWRPLIATKSMQSSTWSSCQEVCRVKPGTRTCCQLGHVFVIHHLVGTRTVGSGAAGEQGRIRLGKVCTQGRPWRARWGREGAGRRRAAAHLLVVGRHLEHQGLPDAPPVVHEPVGDLVAAHAGDVGQHVLHLGRREREVEVRRHPPLQQLLRLGGAAVETLLWDRNRAAR